jgi:inorganic pyrophosphatase
MMQMHDEKGQDDKIIAVHVDDPAFKDYQHIEELPHHVVLELRRFFLDYKTLEQKRVEVDELLGPSDANKAIRAAIDAYKKLKPC